MKNAMIINGVTYKGIGGEMPQCNEKCALCDLCTEADFSDQCGFIFPDVMYFRKESE